MTFILNTGCARKTYLIDLKKSRRNIECYAIGRIKAETCFIRKTKVTQYARELELNYYY